MSTTRLFTPKSREVDKNAPEIMSKIKKSKIEYFSNATNFIKKTHANFYCDPVKTESVIKKKLFRDLLLISILGDSFWRNPADLLYENPLRFRKNRKVANFEKL